MSQPIFSQREWNDRYKEIVREHALWPPDKLFSPEYQKKVVSSFSKRETLGWLRRLLEHLESHPNFESSEKSGLKIDIKEYLDIIATGDPALYLEDHHKTLAERHNNLEHSKLPGWVIRLSGVFAAIYGIARIICEVALRPIFGIDCGPDIPAASASFLDTLPGFFFWVLFGVALVLVARAIDART